MTETATTAAERFFFEAMAPANRADPYPLYAQHRHAGSLTQVDDTIWLCMAHADVTALLHHPALSSDETRATTEVGEPEGNRLKEHSLLFMDPPDHTRLRALVSRAFTPRRVAALRGEVEVVAHALVTDAAGRAADGAAVDWISTVAYPLPVVVICRLLGVPEADEATFSRWSRALARALDPSVLRSPDDEAAIAWAEAELGAYLEALLARRRTQPGDDLLSALAQVEAEGDRISPTELVDLAMLLLVAGHETTVNLIGNATLALARHPDQLDRLRTQPELMAGATDELLRYDSPVQLTQRIATTDLELLGAHVRAGDEIVLGLGAANRDPAAFDDPDRLDVGRDARRHVAFGGGIHHCLGAALARLEGEIAFNAMLARFSALELVGEPVLRPTFVLRGLDHLPIHATLA